MLNRRGFWIFLGNCFLSQLTVVYLNMSLYGKTLNIFLIYFSSINSLNLFL